MSRTLHRKRVRSKAGRARKHFHLAKERWTSRIRVERRNGLTSYAVEFSNGRATATLRGVFSRVPLPAAVVQAEAITAATNWLAHVRPDKNAPAPAIKRPYYIRSETNPNNRQHREHRTGRRAA
jgi:hypothetical protein